MVTVQIVCAGYLFEQQTIGGGEAMAKTTAAKPKQPRLVPIVCLRCRRELIRAIPGAVAYCPSCKRWTVEGNR